MNNLNSVLIEGNLAENPVLDETAGKSPVCDFTIVSTRYYKSGAGVEKEEGRFHVRACGKLAEQAASSGRKGRGVRVVGRLSQERRDGPDGRPRSRIIIVAAHVEFRPEFKAGYEEDENNEQVR